MLKLPLLGKELSSQTHQRRIKVVTPLIANVHQRCFKFNIWLKMKVEPTYVIHGYVIHVNTWISLFQQYCNLPTKLLLASTQIQRCFDVDFNVESTLTKGLKSNVDITSTDVTTLFQQISTLRQR